MGFSKFNKNIVLQILLIVISASAFAFLINVEDKIMARIILSALLMLQTYLLIKYINKVNRDIALFFLRVQEKDTGVNYKSGNVKNYGDLSFSFDFIIKEIQNAKIESEQKSHYLHSIVNHTKIGIIAYDDDGRFELFNPEAAKILQCSKCHLMDTFREECPDFYKKVIHSNDDITLVTIRLSDTILKLSIKKKAISIGSKRINIISFLNIYDELDHHEFESWRKLIKILNHEIMNSMTPITSLSRTIKKSISRDGKELKSGSELTHEVISDISLNSEVIEDRAKSLINFIEVYQSINNPVELKMSDFNLQALVKRVEKFFMPVFEIKQIRFKIKISEDLILNADESLVEQMIINLIKNSVEAIENSTDGKISITAWEFENGKIGLKIKDNGKGIPESEVDKIFAPFYSTKENGSGIGLSLAKHLMYLHNGSIHYTPDDAHTIFVMKF